MLTNYPDILSITDVMKVLRIGRSLAYRLINNGDIGHIRIGRLIKIPKKHIIDYINKQCYNQQVATDISLVNNKEGCL